MKLNKRRTFLIGFAFFGILMLWQVYYFYVPLFLDDLLKNHFGDGDYENIIGHIMSLDNLAAILIIPLFGWLSDRTKTRVGRRMPYIIWGSLLALCLFPLISVMFIINSFVWYIVVVVLLVFAMASFRSPAVSLMPDVTPKPLRTSANAIINFTGYVGAIVGAGLTIVFSADKAELTVVPFVITSLVLVAVIVVFLLKFYENKTVALMKPELEEGERLTQTLEEVREDKPLSKRDKMNFAIIIAIVFFCWFSFNALQNFGSLFGRNVLGTTSNNWGICTTVLAVSSLATFLPSIWLSKKIGRKWAVVTGFCLVITALLMAALFVNSFGVLIVVLFGLSGVGWAIVMVNSYPMFVEISTSKNVGRITGIYYFVSQGAMFLTSNISGYVFRYLTGLEFYFWYAIIFMSVSLVLSFFYRTRKVEKKAS